MQSIAPRYILLGGCFLAFGASFTNVGFLIEAGTSVSHLTGDIGRLGMDLAGEWAEQGRNAILLSAAAAGFFLGALGAGFFLHHPQLELKKPYGRIVAGIGGLFLAGYWILGYSYPGAIFLGGLACGLQNALATKFRGSVLRTTHVTGLLTDLGVLAGMKLRGHQVENWRLWVPFALTIAFLLGAFACGVCVLRFELPWLLISGLAYFLGALGWSVLKRTLFRDVIPGR